MLSPTLHGKARPYLLQLQQALTVHGMHGLVLGASSTLHRQARIDDAASQGWDSQIGTRSQDEEHCRESQSLQSCISQHVTKESIAACTLQVQGYRDLVHRLR